MAFHDFPSRNLHARERTHVLAAIMTFDKPTPLRRRPNAAKNAFDREGQGSRSDIAEGQIGLCFLNRRNGPTPGIGG
jgi:hypothetical protein